MRGLHGLRGELKVELLTHHPDRFRPGATLHAGERTYTVRGARMHQQILLLTLQGIETRAAAETLHLLFLEVPESDLPPLAAGEFYRYQLLGIEVVDAAGGPLGRVDDVIDTGANDVYAVCNDDGELLLPAIDTVVMQVDVAGGRMVVEVPPGLERRPLEKRRSRRQESTR